MTIAVGPAIDAGGNLYVGDSRGRVHAVRPDGNPKWPNPFFYPTPGGKPIWCEAVIGDDGTVYFGTADSATKSQGLLYAVWGP